MKNQLQLQAFSGHKPLTTYHLIRFSYRHFLANLQQLIAKPCQASLEKTSVNRSTTIKINRNIALGVMKNRIVELFLRHNPEYILGQLQKLFLKNLEPESQGREFRSIVKLGGYMQNTIPLLTTKEQFDP